MFNFGRKASVPSTFVDQNYEWYRNFAARIRVAQKFVLTDDVIAAATSVARGRPSSIQAASHYANAPYRASWFEWCDVATRDDINGPFRPKALKRYGLLCETDATARRGTLHMAWTFEDGARVGRIIPEISCLVFEFSYDIPMTDMGMADVERRLKTRMDTKRHLNFLERDEVERNAEASLINEYEGTVSSYYLDVFPMNRREHIRRSLTSEADFMSRQLGYIHEEPSRLKAILILLNTKNGVEQTSADLSEINRTKPRNDKPSLLEHRVVRMRVPGKLRVGGVSEPGEPVSKVRVHSVRGHFKVRQSGVYWWHEFVRGNPKRGMISHDYRVEQQPLHAN